MCASSCSARMALARVSSCLRCAAVTRCAVLSARIDDAHLAAGGVGVQASHNRVEIAQHELVHFDDALLSSGFGGGEADTSAGNLWPD